MHANVKQTCYLNYRCSIRTAIKIAFFQRSRIYIYIFNSNKYVKKFSISNKKAKTSELSLTKYIKDKKLFVVESSHQVYAKFKISIFNFN